MSIFLGFQGFLCRWLAIIPTQVSKENHFLTFRNRKPVAIPIIKRHADAKFGSRKGYFFQNSELPKICGCLSAGRANDPPKAGPKIVPIVHTKGITLKARGCSSFSGTISATIVRIIPTFPFMRPSRAREHSNVAMFCEEPKRTENIMVKVNPARMVGFRPM